MLFVNQNHIKIPLGPGPQETDPLYALYSLMHDRILIVYFDSNIIDDLAAVLSSKIVLRKIDITQCSNWRPNLVDNSVCQNWGIAGHDMEFESPRVIIQNQTECFERLFDHGRSCADLDAIIRYSHDCLGLLWTLGNVYKHFQTALHLDRNRQSKKVCSYHDDSFITQLQRFDIMHADAASRELEDLKIELEKICYWSRDRDELIDSVANLAAGQSRACKFFAYLLGASWI